MTSRRSFLKSLAGIVASVALAQRAVMESLKFETITNEEVFPKGAVNPHWVDAPYERVTIFHPDIFSQQVVSEGPGETEERFTFVDGEFKKVPKFLP